MQNVSFSLSFQHANGEGRSYPLEAGGIYFILGANGTVKSSLMHKFYVDNSAVSRRVTAHRQTWFASNTLEMTAAGKRNLEQSMTSRDTDPDARWKDDYSAHRSGIAIFELIDAENVRARKLTREFDAGNLEGAKEVSKTEAPIKVINELLEQSNLPVVIEIERNEEINARKNGGHPYSIAQLSDGERNAILIAASVLTANPGSLILIDEPERHLHRSIISPLLNLLFLKRSDCAFVVSTHDVMLPLDSKNSQTLLIRSCVYQGAMATRWEADLMPAGSDVNDDIKRDVLGSRKKILYVEGTDKSLDQPLYSLIFPEVSVIAKSSCRDVEHFVSSIRDAAPLHWLSAWGIVDNDRRLLGSIAKLKQKGVHALEHHSVESIYYHPDMLRRVAVRHSEVTGGDPGKVAQDAISAVVAAIAPHKERLSARVSENKVREAVFRNLPTGKSIQARVPIKIDIDVSGIVAEEVIELDKALSTADIKTLLGRYPIRETPALGAIVEKLGFQSEEQYESSVRKLLSDDNEALQFVRSLFGDLIKDLEGKFEAASLTSPPS